MTLTPSDIKTTNELALMFRTEIQKYPISDILIGVPNSIEHFNNLNNRKWVETSKVADELGVILTQLAQYQLAFQVDDFADYDYQLQKAKIEAIYKTVVNFQQTLRGESQEGKR